MLAGVFSHFFRAMRWKMLIKPMGYTPSNRNITMAVFIGFFANLALPRLGEVSKCGALAKYEKIPMNKMIGTVITERGIDLITFVGLFLITVLYNFNKIGAYFQTKVTTPLSEEISALQNPHVLIYTGLALLLITIIIIYYYRNRFSQKSINIKINQLIKGLFEGIKSLSKIKNPFLFILYTSLIWIFYWLMTQVVFMSLAETINLDYGVGLVALMFGSVGLIVVQGGIGIYPAIIAETLFLYHIPETTGYALGWLLWSGQTLLIIVLGTISFGLLPVLNRKKSN